MKKALIIGSTGQDGAYLAKFLYNKGYQVYGTYRNLPTSNLWRLQYLNIHDNIKLLPIDMLDGNSITKAITTSQPDEVYNLASQSTVRASFEQPITGGEDTGLGVTRILEAIRDINPKIRFYQASSSELFTRSESGLRTEMSPFHPGNPYAAAKLYAYWMTNIYRDTYGIFVCNGILFNHESPLRGLEFVSRKISNTVAKIFLGLEKRLYLGSLEAERDWGYATEYVEAMWSMLQQPQSGDYVIATGEAHSVKEFVVKAFGIFGLNWQEYVRVDKGYLTPLVKETLRGDYSKAKKVLGWEPKIKFDKLVELMVNEDLSRWQRRLKGEKFPWDITHNTL
jgi:GDPmannose 4,6-dehydratase